MSNQEHNAPPIKLTPMFEQYMRIKEETPDTLLFFRMGDFYELFFDDAVIAARELQITLTSRSKDSASPIPMCGVPWHAVDNYTSILVNRGFRVSMCDQAEDPKDAKGLVKREVVRTLTPGTVLEDANLTAKSHNYLGALYWDVAANAGGFAWVDVSTGLWTGLYAKKPAELWQWVQKLTPRELLLPDDAAPPAGLLLEGVQLLRVASRSHFDLATATRRVLETQNVQEDGALGLNNKPELMRACGALLIYLGQTQRCELSHLQPFRPLELGRHLIVDELTERNLEVFVRLNGRKGTGTLWHVLDETQTPMGGRLLEERLRHPWRECETIRKNQAAVGFFCTRDEQRRTLRTALNQVYDLERLSTRISLNRANPRDYIALRNSLLALPSVQTALTAAATPQAYATAADSQGEELPESLYGVLKNWDNLTDTAELLQRALLDSPPNVITDGGLFKSGYDAELDALLDLAEHGEQKLQALLEEEQTAAQLPKLKLGYNRVFGYYFELTRAGQSSPAPEHFIRRQTLANGERFTTVRLKELEEQILSASDKRKSLEYSLFQKLREDMAALRPRLLFVAELLAHLDYWQSLAEVARRWAWCAPVLSDDNQDILIRDGRHPVVESIVGSANFVANDVRLDEQRRLCLITGPNMAGKSTILRQTAIICLLAHMGSFVPAREARMGLIDRIFSRVGASDNLAQGQSTFMVEMMETARILRQSTKRSLVILDEIGRGTSTYDGLALAWAVVEELTKRGQGCIRTLFATHYHELTALEGKLPRLFTMNIAIREHGGEILFMHRLVPGPSDRSYGVEVARLAGVPMPVVQRAREILADLERTRDSVGPKAQAPSLLPGLQLPISRKKGSEPDAPPTLPGVATPLEHPLIQMLKEAEPEQMTPLEALRLLSEWKILWGK